MWVYFVFFDELEAKNYSRRGVRVFPLAAAKVAIFSRVATPIARICFYSDWLITYFLVM